MPQERPSLKEPLNTASAVRIPAMMDIDKTLSLDQGARTDRVIPRNITDHMELDGAWATLTVFWGGTHCPSALEWNLEQIKYTAILMHSFKF